MQILQNSLFATSGSTHNKELFGGSEVFLTTTAANFSNCSFVSNKKGAGLKLYNIFDDDTNLFLLNKNENKISFSSCTFEQIENSDNSIFIVSVNKENEIDIVDCEFKGKLKKGFHYIDAQISFKGNPRFFINWCKFDDESGSLLNVKTMEKAELNQQNEKISSINLNLVVLIILSLFASVLITLLIRTKRQNDEIQEDISI